ncbi:MAG: NAD(P)/FAD-dependent oxidoreductase [Deltaproteobacteria bacterium]|nr:NAD(P)/FAD-dependent oxidoreductase [Deltaproteobacteria bacterium]
MSKTSAGLLFIGNGGAAISAVRAARAVGYESPIQMISDTCGDTFNPMLSPYYLAGHIPFERCFPFGREFYTSHGVTCHFGSPVEVLDPFSKEARLADGRVLTYDRCLVATGARPVLPRVSGIDQSRYVYTLRTAEDAIHLSKAVERAKDVLVLGASLIGLKMAEILLSKGARVTLVDVAEHVLPSVAHPRCAAIVEEVVRNRGVDLRLKRSLSGVEDGRERAGFHFQDGETVEADLCLVSIGIEPRVGFIDASQVMIDKGIVVDHRMRTSAEDLYAAGDVSQGMNLVTGHKEIIGLWGNACYQGRAAGYNMAGREARYRGAVPEHVSTLFGLNFVHLGNVNLSEGETEIIADPGLSEYGYHLLCFEKGILKGANLLQDPGHAGRLKTAILRRFDWTRELDKLRPYPDRSVLDRILCAWFGA